MNGKREKICLKKLYYGIFFFFSKFFFTKKNIFRAQIHGTNSRPLLGFSLFSARVLTGERQRGIELGIGVVRGLKGFLKASQRADFFFNFIF